MAARNMPQNIEAEMSVLGVPFLNPYAMEKITENLTEDMFFVDAHRKIYNALVSLYKENVPIDIKKEKEVRKGVTIKKINKNESD